jgi:hypothetical protein
MHYESPRLEPDGRITVIRVAGFVELAVWGRDLEGEGQAAIEAHARAAASGEAGPNGHAEAPRVTAAAQGGEKKAAVKARSKAMNDLFGSRVGRGQRVLQDYPTDRRVDHRTLALKVATLNVVNALGVHAAGSEEPKKPEQPKEPVEPEEGTKKGKGKGKGKKNEKEECLGLPHLSNLTWA